MHVPQLIYAVDENYPDEVAVSASLVPTFEPPTEQQQLEVIEEEEPS